MDTDRTGTTPRNVKIAIGLLGVGVGISIVNIILYGWLVKNVLPLIPHATVEWRDLMAPITGLWLITMFFYILPFWNIVLRKNWARWLFATGAGLSVVSYLDWVNESGSDNGYVIVSGFTDLTMEGVIIESPLAHAPSLLTIGVHLTIVVLLFTASANRWFRGESQITTVTGQ